jgi:2-C-methyl-D-erythritol 4-phosphate cytidylyltransferase
VSGRAWSLVIAAGQGRRFGRLKQFDPLGDRRVVDWTVAAARASTAGVVVVLPAGYAWDGEPVEAVVAGGAQHADSVRAGLEALGPEVDVVVVASSAHPLASPLLYRAVVAAVEAGADAAVPAVPFSDAVKRLSGARVVETVPKADLASAQSPAAFRVATLRGALASGGAAPEELELLERMGAVVHAVPGEVTNVHVTTPEELGMAQALLPLVADRWPPSPGRAAPKLIQ